MFLLWLRQLPRRGDWIPALVPPPTEGRSHPTNTPVSPPSSFVLPSFAWFSIFFSGGLYSFLVVGYSCTLSAGVLQALLCLKVYSWCICGERCTPHPPAPLPSCSLLCFLFLYIYVFYHIYFWLAFSLFLTFIPEYFMSICVVVFLITFSNWLLLMYQRAIAYWFC